jgi:hypothetical protein
MPLSPHIIKHPIDDEEYANAAPTIGTLMLAHFSTPERHSTVIYGADSLFFATFPMRRIYLRRALRGEFDIFTSENDYQARPVLWLLVQKTSPGYHMIIPVWRGQLFWSGLDTDKAVANAVEKMSLRQGLHLSEWHSFVCDQRVRKTNAADNAKRSKKPQVN